MNILHQIYWLAHQAVIVVIVTVIALVVLRLIINQVNPNPFGWTSITVRRLTDPLIAPVRRALFRFGVDAKYAPLVTILVTILLGWFCLELVSVLAFTIDGILSSLNSHAMARLLGFVLHGLLSLYSFLIFIRIISSWIGSYGRGQRFLVRSTEPLLGPLRRLIPLVSGFDISPIIALFIVRLLQGAIVATLIGG